jgi:hypothetical protein
MKTFFELRAELLEATLAMKLRAAKAKAHKVTKGEAKPKPKRRSSTFPWWMDGKFYGWWSPSSSFLFTWNFSWGSSGNYHVTQIVKKPQIFGLTKEVLLKEIQKWIDIRASERTAEEIYNDLVIGKIDKFGFVERMAFKKGWVRVMTSNKPSENFIEVEGYKPSLKKAVASIAMDCPQEEGRSYFVNVQDAERPVLGGINLDSVERMERYARTGA